MRRLLAYTICLIPALLAGGVTAIALDQWDILEPSSYFTIIISLPVIVTLLLGNVLVERVAPVLPNRLAQHLYQCLLCYVLVLICGILLLSAEQTGSLQFAYVKGFLLTASWAIIVNIIYSLVKKHTSQ